MRHFEFEKLSRFIEKDLPDSEAEEIRLHLDECSVCRKKLEQMSQIIKNLGELEKHEAPARIFAALRRELQPPVPSFVPRRWFVGARALIAASLLLMVCGYLTFSSLYWNKPSDNIARKTPEASGKSSTELSLNEDSAVTQPQRPQEATVEERSAADPASKEAAQDEYEALKKENWGPKPALPEAQPLAKDQIADKAKAREESNLAYSKNKSTDSNKQPLPATSAELNRLHQEKKTELAKADEKEARTRGDIGAAEGGGASLGTLDEVAQDSKNDMERILPDAKREEIAKQAGEKDKGLNELASAKVAPGAASPAPEKKAFEPVVKIQGGQAPKPVAPLPQELPAGGKLADAKIAPAEDSRKADKPAAAPKMPAGIVQVQPNAEEAKVAIEQDLKNVRQKAKQPQDLARNNAAKGGGGKGGVQYQEAEKKAEEKDYADRTASALEPAQEAGFGAAPAAPAEAQKETGVPKSVTKKEKKKADKKESSKDLKKMEEKNKQTDAFQKDAYREIPGGETIWTEILKKHNTEESKTFNIYIESWERISFGAPRITDGNVSKWHNKVEAEAVLEKYLKTMPPVASVLLGKNLKLKNTDERKDGEEIAQWLVSKGIGNIKFVLAMSSCTPPVVGIYKDGKRVKLPPPTPTPEKK